MIWLAAPCTTLVGGEFEAGVGRVDITPEHAVRLQGFGVRRAESEGVDQRLYARALAIQNGDEEPVVIVTADQCIVLDEHADAIHAMVKKATGLPRDRFAVSLTHSHTTPVLTNAAPTLFSTPISAEHQANIDRYTRYFIERVAQAAIEALSDLRPATLAWNVGTVAFAKNRRTPGGPVDHDLPVMLVCDAEGKVRAVLTTYACHCVTLSHNKVAGDWAGYASAYLESMFPGAVGLVSIGGGADANPSSGVTGDRLDIASDQGMRIADEVRRLSEASMLPISGPIASHLNHITLPLAELPDRTEWEKRATREDYVGFHAKHQLGLLDRGEKLPTEVEYPVQTMVFGDDLAMVFLGGELVVDYALRLKKELDSARVWVHGYSNHIPGYIPSERVLREGGYEGGGAMYFYGIPTGYAPGLEDKIVNEVKAQLGDTFKGDDAARTDGTRPLSPARALGSLKVKEGFAVELVAAEPLVEDPVAIAWAPDGSLFVAEMRDYPMGIDGDYKPGGAVRRLVDRDGDGCYDVSTVFLPDVPFPTGVTAYRKGVLVCAAPDILYAEDTDGDGVADIRRKLYEGFTTHNYQARINSITLGLDGWWYVSGGLFGGRVRSFSGVELDVTGRDFRIMPDTGAIDTVEGQSQQSRVRNDFGDWFGCNSGTLLQHYPMPDRYVRRNPDYSPPSSVVALSGAAPVMPITTHLQMFALSGDVGNPTAACGVTIYRDTLLGRDYFGDSFTCEPVYNLVVRQRLTRDGVTFTAARADDEARAEFLASTDAWFRPVEARTGPDGALYVADMYRFVIEHPIWVPEERVKQIDVRAGAGMGRIYRVYPRGTAPRRLKPLGAMSTIDLAEAINDPSGTRRDLAHAMLLWRADKAAVEPLRALANNRGLSAPVRIQAAAALHGLHALDDATLSAMHGDDDPEVLRQALRMGEWRTPVATVAALTRHPDARVRQQAAFSLGGYGDDRAGDALGLLLAAEDDPFVIAAALSSATGRVAPMVGGVLRSDNTPRRGQIVKLLIDQAVRQGETGTIARLIDVIVESRDLSAAGTIIDSLRAQGSSLEALRGMDEMLERAIDGLDGVFAEARRIAPDTTADPLRRIAAVGLLGGGDLDLLAALLSPRSPPALQRRAVEVMGASNEPRVPAMLLDRWATLSPLVRDAALDMLIARRAWTGQLLDAMGADSALARALDPSRRSVLLAHPDAALREQAGRMLALTGTRSRQEVIDRYAAAVDEKGGDPARGSEVFVQSCAVCHTLRGVGHAVGPDLASLTDTSAAALLDAILDPNRAVLDRYLGYIVSLRDGRSLVGVIAAETGSGVTLKLLDGSAHDILRRDITSMVGTGRSLMPEGLESAVSPRQMADLIAYIRDGAGRPRYTYAGPGQPSPIYPDHADSPRLTDGSLGTGRFDDRQWIGFPRSGTPRHPTPRLVFDLGAERPLDSITITYGVNHAPGGIHAPHRLCVAYSGDGADYSEPVVYEGFDDSPDGLGTYQIARRIARVAPGGLAARYVRLEFFNPTGWTFLSEVSFNAPPSTDASTLSPAAPTRSDPRASLSAAQRITQELTGFTPGTPGEYQRIPGIWRIAIEAGKRGDDDELRDVLDVALPREGDPLRDWQAVVIGGGVINGLSMEGVMPATRISNLIGDRRSLADRVSLAIVQASAMADNDQTPHGTRYDALRMLALGGWEAHGEHVARYLAPGVNDELRMGAWSALCDMPEPPAAHALLDAIGESRLKPGELADYQQDRLRRHADADVRRRAAQLLPE